MEPEAGYAWPISREWQRETRCPQRETGSDWVDSNTDKSEHVSMARAVLHPSVCTSTTHQQVLTADTPLDERDTCPYSQGA